MSGCAVSGALPLRTFGPVDEERVVGPATESSRPQSRESEGTDMVMVAFLRGPPPCLARSATGTRRCGEE